MIKIRRGLPVALAACALTLALAHAAGPEAAGMVIKVTGKPLPILLRGRKFRQTPLSAWARKQNSPFFTMGNANS